MTKNKDKNQKRTGLLALIGAAAGAYAFYKYKTMSQEEKQQLKDKVTDTGRKIKETVGDVESTISNKYDEFKNKSANKYDDLKNKGKEEFKDIVG